MSTNLQRVIHEMEVGGKAHAVTTDLGIFGYTLVGSSAYLQGGRDIDIVLLARGDERGCSPRGTPPASVPEELALRTLCKALKPMDSLSIWYSRMGSRWGGPHPTRYRPWRAW